jgi:hypothetical protein
MSSNKLLVYLKYLDDNLVQSYNHQSLSSVGFPVLFIKPSDKFVLLCISYHSLNEYTINNKYLLSPSQAILR